MAASIIFNQATLEPVTATPGARTDGLAGGELVTVRNASGAPCRVELRWVPPSDTGVVATLTQVAPDQWTFAPTPACYGSYKVWMVEAEGTSQETTDEKVFGIRLPNTGMLIPALNEVGDPTIHIGSSPTEKELAAKLTTNNEATPEGIRYAGWWRTFSELVMSIEELDGVTMDDLNQLADDIDQDFINLLDSPAPEPVSLFAPEPGVSTKAARADHLHSMPTIAARSIIVNAAPTTETANDVLTFGPAEYLTVDNFNLSTGVLEARTAPTNSMRLRRGDSSPFHAEQLAENSLFLRGGGNIVQATAFEGFLIGRPEGGNLGAHSKADLGLHMASGTYTATISGASGVSGISASGIYTVENDIVTVALDFEGTGMSGTGEKWFRITLPVEPANNFVDASQIKGVASSRLNDANSHYYGGEVNSNASTKLAVVLINNPETSGAFVGSAYFRYQI